MSKIDSITSVIILNVNVPSVSVKRQRLSDWTNQEIPSYMLFIRNFMFKDRDK